MEDNDKFAKYRKEEDKPKWTERYFSKENNVLYGLLILAVIFTVLSFPKIKILLEEKTVEGQRVRESRIARQKVQTSRYRSDIVLREEGKALITTIDVGQGDAILIETPNGHVALYDAGEGKNPDNRFARATNAGERIILPFLRDKGIDRINTVILSHPHSDHIGGFLEIIQQIPVDEVVDPGHDAPSGTYRQILEFVKEKDIRYIVPEQGEVLDWGPDVYVKVLWVDKEAHEINNTSIVLLFQYGDIRTLLTGDAHLEVEKDIVLKYGNNFESHILKVSHHGSRTSTGDLFVNYLSPEVSLIGVGGYNTYGHPTAEVLNRLKSAGSKIYRTDNDGHIFVSISPDTYSIVTSNVLKQ